VLAGMMIGGAGDIPGTMQGAPSMGGITNLVGAPGMGAAIDGSGMIHIIPTEPGHPPGMSGLGLIGPAGPAKLEGNLHPERKRRASGDSLDSSTRTSETPDEQGKDDDDDDDGDDEDTIKPGSHMDPDRLKSFNMFVRLFVDENLDRMVPISKQPKDKIQAILDACDRQFPEFHERARKRIRTYLKSCRRMRRSKENGWEALRPTPPHLTSACAESILAQACENESNNAKRMRMGLDPLPAAIPPPVAVQTPAVQNRQGSPACPTQVSPHIPVQQITQQLQSQPLPPVSMNVGVVGTCSPTVTPQASLQTQSQQIPEQRAAQFIQAGVSTTTAATFRAPHELPSPFFSNSNGIFRPGFPAAYQSPAHHHNGGPAPQQQQTISPIVAQLQNGTGITRPTDLSMKKSSIPGPASKAQLNPNEVATIKQLIAGYRESAAFLYRSADELEQLLLQQN